MPNHNPARRHDWQYWQSDTKRYTPLFVRYCKPCDIVQQKQGELWKTLDIPFSKVAIQLTPPPISRRSFIDVELDTVPPVSMRLLSEAVKALNDDSKL